MIIEENVAKVLIENGVKVHTRTEYYIDDALYKVLKPIVDSVEKTKSNRGPIKRIGNRFTISFDLEQFFSLGSNRHKFYGMLKNKYRNNYYITRQKIYDDFENSGFTISQLSSLICDMKEAGVLIPLDA